MLSDMKDRTLAVKEVLRSRGLKATPQRIAVYDSMMKLGHASADMVGNDISTTYPTLTVATIYNVLEMFVENGLLARRYSSNNKMYFDVNTHEHVHIYCRDDNSFEDYEDGELVRIVDEHLKSRNLEGYEVTGVDIQIIGTRI